MSTQEARLGLPRGARAVIPTKLEPHALPEDHLPRPRLLRALGTARLRPLTVIAAAPGSGKTILLTEWASALGSSSRWLGLDDDDNDPVRFWDHVLASLDLPLPAAVGDGTAAVAVLAQPSVRSPVVLLVDQVHALVRPDARHALHLLVEHAPDWLHLGLACRARPAISLHLHRTRDRLHELGGDELAFTRSELAALAAAAGRPFDDTAISRLAERTEGWAAGVRLGVSSLVSASDPDDLLDRFDGTTPHVAEYLRKEILEPQPRSVRKLLEDVAPFEHFDAGLCRAVTGRARAVDLLRELVDANVLLTERSEQPGTYRVHRMLRELLLDDVRAAGPGRLRELHGLAAGWLERAGESLEAAEEWTRAGRSDEAARVVDDAIAELYAAGRLDQLRRWTVAGAPASGTTPWALLDLATRLTLGAEEQAGRDVLDQVDALLEQAPDPVAEVRATCVRSVFDLMQGDVRRATDDLEALGERIEASPDLDDDPRLRSRGVVRHADLWAAVGRAWLEEPHPARRAIARSVRPGGGRDRISEHFRAAALAWVSVVEGNLLDGERLAKGALAEMGDAGDSHHICVFALCSSGRVALERNDLATAEALLERAVTVTERLVACPPLIAAEADLASVWFAQGRRDEALTLLARVRRDAGSRLAPLMADWINARQASLLLRSGNVDAAVDAAQRLSAAAAPLVRARVLAASGQPAAAEALLERAPVDTPRQRLGLALGRSQAAWTARQLDDALARLGEAIEIAGPLRFVRTVIESGPHVRPLLDRVPAGSDGYVAALRAAAGREASVASAPHRRGPCDQLSPREREILGYLPTALSSREIARDLFVSANTLKTHTSHIYRKLDVSSREEAVARARVLGLLR